MLNDPRFPPNHPRNLGPVEPADIYNTAIMLAQQRLDSFARERGYDGILSACTYAGSSITKFATEAATCKSLRDSTWSTLYNILAEVEANTRPVPTVQQIISELPALNW